MDIKAHGSALARFATRWEAKTRSMYMNLDSDSIRIDPLKHLQTSKWPCLEFITCHGKYGNALPISCFSGENSSNLQFVAMSQCSLAVEAVQSLVATCPYLYGLSLAACKLAAAALTCLSQARFLSLKNLNLSGNSLGWLGVQSLSSCHLPALQWLTLTDTNVNALAAMHLARGCWPNLQQLHLFDNQLNAEAIAYLINGDWPLLRELGLLRTCVPEAVFEVLGVVNACKQFESTQPKYTYGIKQCLLLRSSFLVWPKLKELTINLPLV